MENKTQAAKAVVKLMKYLEYDMSYVELDRGTENESLYSKVYWLYQDVVNFMDHYNQQQTEFWINYAKEIVDNRDVDKGYNTIAYRNKLKMALIQMGHGLGVNWDKEKIY